MKSKFSKMMNVSLLTSVLFIAMGIAMFIFTNVKLETLSLVIAGIFIFNGACNMIDDYKVFKPFYFFDGFTSGLLSVILSIIIVSNPDYVNILLPMMVGLWFIINSTFKLRMALALKDSNNTYWPITYILSLLTIICGLCLIFNPEIAALSMVKVLGALTIVYSICDIIDVVIFKKNIKGIAKVFE